MNNQRWQNSPFGENSIFHPNYDIKANTKSLNIRFQNCNNDDTHFHLAFEVLAKNLTKTDAYFFVVESEIIEDEPAVPMSIVNINPNGLTTVTVKFDINTKFSKSIFEGDLEFVGVIECDNISARTSEFSLKSVRKKVAKSKSKEKKDKKASFKTCPIDPNFRSHFVLHCTAGEMSVESIKELTKYDTKKRLRSKAHVYVMKDGTTLQIWPFSEENVWATKTETQNELKGQMFHVEINYGSPDAPTKEQYDTLANLYIEASNIEKCWPIIVPHIEVDRGLADGHSDPTDFNYNAFYEILKSKTVPIDDIPKFDHERYWGNDTYKVPWSTDKNNWPPILKGNPHK